MARTFQVVVDCTDPDRLAEFWSVALGYSVQSPPEGSQDWERYQEDRGFPPDERVPFAAISHPEGAGRICFMGVSEPKTVKNRLHLDIDAAAAGTDPEDRRLSVDRLAQQLVQAGATVLRVGHERNQYFVTVADPEGNELCVH